MSTEGRLKSGGGTGGRKDNSSPQVQELDLLIIEDSKESYFELCDLFNRIPDPTLKLSLDWVTDDKSVLSALSSKKYSVAVYSIGDQYEAALKLISKIRAQKHTVPIIVIGEHSSGSVDLDALRAGASDYLLRGILKPIFLERSLKFSLARKNTTDRRLAAEKQIMDAQRMKSLGNLAGSIAHSVNNSLGAVVGHLGLIERAAEDQPDVLRSAQIALQAAQETSALIQHLLDFTGKDSSKMQDINLQQVVLEGVETLSHLLKKNISIATAYDRSRGFPIKGNPSLIRQILTNIAINSQEAMPKGGTIHFAFRTHFVDGQSNIHPGASTGKYVVLEIKDTGCGIPEEYRDRVLEPSFSTKHDSHGLGLGLAMAYNVMEIHSGWIDVQSEVGDGTTISLFFPLTEQGVEQPIYKEPVEGTRGTVLVIEDEAVLAELSKMYLEAAGFSVRVFTSSPAAVAWYTQNFEDIDMILLDLVMPELSGRECFDAIRKVNPGAKIAICAGYLDDEAQNLLDEGALKFFQKPGNYPTIIGWMAEFFDH